MIYCRPYSLERKGKLERFHLTFREQFLNELDLNRVANIDELNAHLRAWIESVYHIRPHAGSDKLDTNMHQTPIARWRQDLNHVHPLTTSIAERLDDINRALASRIQAWIELKPILDHEAFKQLLIHGFTQAGCTHKYIV